MENKKSYGNKGNFGNKKSYGNKAASADKPATQGENSPEAKLSCIHDGEEKFTNLTGLWIRKKEDTGRIYLVGTDKESGTTFTVNFFTDRIKID